MKTQTLASKNNLLCEIPAFAARQVYLLISLRLNPGSSPSAPAPIRFVLPSLSLPSAIHIYDQIIYRQLHMPSLPAPY